MQKMRPVLTAAWAMMLLSAMSAACASDAAVWRHRQKTVDAFYKQPLRQQLATFPTYEFDDQYAIFLYGNQAREPPAIYLAAPFAALGTKIVAPLSQHLSKTKSDSTVRDLVLVFSEMNRQNSYKVSDDAALMRMLTAAVAGMKNPGWKEISEKELSSIRQ